MNQRITQSLEAYVTIVAFIKRKKPGGGRLTSALTTLEEAIVGIRAAAAAQLIAQRGNVVDGRTRKSLRAEIRQGSMIPIARDGRRFFRDEPGIAAVFTVPHANDSDAEVVAAAAAMMGAVRSHLKCFHEMGYQKGFLKPLDAATKQLERWAEHTEATSERRVAANRELATQMARARHAVRVIDGLMLGFARQNPSLASEWKQMRRIPKKKGRPKGSRADPGAS